MSRPYIILDRDGTVIEEKHYLSDPDQVALLPGAAEGLRRFQDQGFGLVIVSNQSGIGRGYFSAQTVARVNERMIQLLGREGVRIDGIYVCPHSPEDGCECRKPKPGLVIQAAKSLNFDATECWVIGDKTCDVELGNRVGAATLLVRTGYGSYSELTMAAASDGVVDDMCAAARFIQERIESRILVIA